MAKLTAELNETGVHVIFMTNQDTLGRFLRLGLGGTRTVSPAHRQKVREGQLNIPWLSADKECWGDNFPTPIFFAAPISQTSSELQKRYFLNGPNSAHRGDDHELNCYSGQNWSHSHFLEHVMVSPANTIRPIRSYAVPTISDSFQLSRIYGLGGREYCPVSNEPIYKSTGHDFVRGSDGKVKVK